MGDIAIGTILARALAPLVTALARKALTKPTGAGLVSEPVRLDSRIRLLGSKKGINSNDIERLANGLDRKIQPLISIEYRDIPDNERTAAIETVEHVLASSAPLGMDEVFNSDLDPELLYQWLHNRDIRSIQSAELNRQGRDLFEHLLRLCCVEVIEFTTTQSEFLHRAAVEQLRRTSTMSTDVQRIRDLIDQDTSPFEGMYRDIIVRRLDRLQLFGVTFATESTYPLSTAYLSLSVSSTISSKDVAENIGNAGTTSTVFSGERVEQAMRAGRRIVIRGGAGSGKTTLLQWLAVNCAKNEGPDALAAWRGLIPFFLPLRQFVQNGTFPTPENFLSSSVGRNIADQMPRGWVHSILHQGQALVLVDGVDEVPEHMRPQAKEWLRALVSDFPEVQYIVTSRPPAVDDLWLAAEEFVTMDLLPMSPSDVRMFIKHWHDAAREEVKTDEERETLTRYETALAHIVVSQRQLNRLATNPLLCALLCALYRDRRMQLPRDRMELYQAALDMLLTRRDAEREIKSPTGVTLGTTQSIKLLQKFAFWLISNGYTDVDRESAIRRFGDFVSVMPQIPAKGDRIYSHLLLRSGLLREPIDGRVDFVHRTFEEYLGAKEAVDSDSLGVLIGHAHEDQWHGVLTMAVGHARPKEQQRLLVELLDRGDREEEHRARLHLLAAACLENIHEVDGPLYQRVRHATEALIPPTKFRQAEELASAGDMVLDLLPTGPRRLPARTVAAIIRTASLIGGEAAINIVSRFEPDDRVAVQEELINAWSRFDTDIYARQVLSRHSWRHSIIDVRSEQQLRALINLPGVAGVRCIGDFDLSALRELKGLRWLHMLRNFEIQDFSFVKFCPNLTSLHIAICPGIRSLEGIWHAPELESLTLDSYPGPIDWSLLAASRSIKLLELRDVPIMRFDGIAMLRGLERLSLSNCLVAGSFDILSSLPLRALSLNWNYLTVDRQARRIDGSPYSASGPRAVQIGPDSFRELSDVAISLNGMPVDNDRDLIDQALRAVHNRKGFFLQQQDGLFDIP
ncbi:NACHT domain-containing protein [Nocardia niigatensis]